MDRQTPLVLFSVDEAAVVFCLSQIFTTVLMNHKKCIYFEQNQSKLAKKISNKIIFPV